LVVIGSLVTAIGSLFVGIGNIVLALGKLITFISTSEATMSAFAVAAAPWLITLAAIAAAVYLIANAFSAMEDAAAAAMATASKGFDQANKAQAAIDAENDPTKKARLIAAQAAVRSSSDAAAAVGQRYTGASGFGNAILDFFRGNGSIQ